MANDHGAVPAMDMVENEQRENFLYAVARRKQVEEQTQLVTANIRQVDATTVHLASNADFARSKALYYRCLGGAVYLVALGIFAVLLAFAVTR